MNNLKAPTLLLAISLAACEPADDSLPTEQSGRELTGSTQLPVVPEASEEVSSDPEIANENAQVTRKLPRNLSPKARKLLLRSADLQQTVRLRIEVRSPSSMETLRTAFDDLDVEILSEDMETRQLSATASPTKLREIAELADIVYIETGASYRR